MNMNALTTDWPQAPTDASFKLAARRAGQINVKMMSLIANSILNRSRCYGCYGGSQACPNPIASTSDSRGHVCNGQDSV